MSSRLGTRLIVWQRCPAGIDADVDADAGVDVSACQTIVLCGVLCQDLGWRALLEPLQHWFSAKALLITRHKFSQGKAVGCGSRLF